jgi:uracil-DNA glycosylase
MVGNAPTKFDVKEMTPWTGDAGTLLEAELRKAGFNYLNIRITNMWQHAKVKECEFHQHLDVLLAEMKGRDVIILMGAETVEYFTGEKVSEVSGLQVTSKEWFNADDTVYALFNPGVAMRTKIGEVRHGLKMIKEDMR